MASLKNPWIKGPAVNIEFLDSKKIIWIPARVFWVSARVSTTEKEINTVENLLSSHLVSAGLKKKIIFNIESLKD